MQEGPEAGATAATKQKASWLPEGMDASSTYLVTLKLTRKTPPREGFDGYYVEWPIDADTTNFKDFIDDIRDKYPWGFYETVVVQYVDSGNLMTMTKDEELLAMFKCFETTKMGEVVLTILLPNEVMDTNVQCMRQNIGSVFGYAEDRECMRHLVTNFKLKFRGKVFDEHFWPAAYSWTSIEFDEHMAAMEQGNPSAVAYLNTWHKRIWSRSKFSTSSKVDYVTNNLAECFNNWIKKHKSLMLYEDKIRRKLMVLTDRRRIIAKKLQREGKSILPHVKSELNDKSRGLDLVFEGTDDTMTEVREQRFEGKRHVVDLEARTCTCRAWQVTGKPCEHDICFITSIRTLKLEDFVDDCYSVSKFAAASTLRIPSLTDISQWPKDNHRFYLHPPILGRSAGRQKKERFKGGLENRGKNGQHQCPVCTGYGHRWKTCKQATPEAKEAYAAMDNQKKSKKKIRKTTQHATIAQKTPSSSQSAAIGASSSSVLAIESAPAGTTPLHTVAAAPSFLNFSNRKKNSGSNCGSNQPPWLQSH